MTDAIEKQLTGHPVTIAICGETRRLEYRFAAILAYQEKTGDSLFDREAYARIDLTRDPKRWLACLWAGLHVKQGEAWVPSVTIEQLTDELDLDVRKAGEISRKMVEALATYFPKPEPAAKTPAPAGSGDETPAPPYPSSSSGPGPVVVTSSAVSSS